jgi:PAS domain-containing protein
VLTVAPTTSRTAATASRNSTTIAYATVCTSSRKALALKLHADSRSHRKPFFISPIGCSGTGRNSQCVEFIIDVTVAKQAEAALRESEGRLRAVLVAGHMETWYWDPAADRVTASATLADLFGLLPGGSGIAARRVSASSTRRSWTDTAP